MQSLTPEDLGALVPWGLHKEGQTQRRVSLATAATPASSFSPDLAKELQNQNYNLTQENKHRQGVNSYVDLGELLNPSKTLFPPSKNELENSFNFTLTETAKTCTKTWEVLSSVPSQK